MLVTLKELLDQAKVEHKADGAFNGTTLEAIRGIIQAAEELNAPVILQHAQSHDDLIDLEEIGPVMKYYAERAKVPVALHLDHGSSFERCVQALRLGFTSVMYDASAKSFEENAMIKAEAISKMTGEIVLADDSGLEIDYLNKEPGIYSARYMGEDTSYHIKNASLIERLNGVPDEKRTARFVCAVAAAFPDGSVKTVRGTMEGRIGYEEKGENGFGYDPIFYLPEYGREK